MGWKISRKKNQKVLVKTLSAQQAGNNGAAEEIRKLLVQTTLS